MNLEKATYENLTIILKELSKKLDIANKSLMKPEDYDLNKYDDLKFMYEVVLKKGSLSPGETQAFISELRAVRKQ